uniref:Uncharacterized protein LOC100375625 n=1 Tax=Saccoglossus kowalevskii TaxID=10224 RepID=A0ABM0MDH3_SACKO|nr:PREDICTED: uncharacterized protein LOC100375625 [Saccoglossus kowalevskii]
MATVKTYVILSAFLILFVAKCSAEDASITQQVQQFMKQMRLNIREGWKAFTKTMQPHVDKYLTPYLQGFYTFTDETSKELFGMEAAKLPRHAEKNTPEIVTAVLTSFWLILALVVAVMSGAGSSLYISAFLFLLYGIFGASWCLKRVIYTSGLFCTCSM